MKKWHIEEKNGYNLVINEGGATLGYNPESGIKLIEEDGFAFKDLNQNGILDPYEDWRLPAEERAADLISKMDTDSKLGLSLHDGMFTVMKITEEAMAKNPFLRAKLALAGKNQENAAEQDPAEITDYHRALINKDEMRFWLLGAIDGPEYASTFVNRVQALAEGHKYGIPVFFSTNPRAFKDAHSDTADRDVSCWPSNLGMGATFDPAVAKEMAETVSKEYRALGVTIELGPQVDLASDPRWSRMSATYGSSEKLNADIARAVCDGYQTTEGAEDGWGADSVLAMCKHWPGSTGEGGRESHAESGKYTVYPGNNMDKHIYPWTEGAFKLDGPTKQCAAVMSCYDDMWDVGGDEAETVGASFNKYVVDRMLREQNDFKGFVCTDFWITGNLDKSRATRPHINSWGVLDYTPPQRALKEWEAGVDQCGGTNEIEVMQGAYKLALERHGENWANRKINTIAERVLTPEFRLGSFENPYSDPEFSEKFVGREDFKAKGIAAHRKSVVLVKNNGVLPHASGKVYIADKFGGGIPDRSGHVEPITSKKPFAAEEASKYFEVSETIEEADCAIVVMDSPQSGSGYDGKEKKYIPISLQYNDYTAVNAREVSIAGDYIDGVRENRSYRGNSVKTYNKYDLDNLLEVKEKMGDKPVIVVLRCTNPVVPSEFEPYADAVIVTFTGTPDAVIFELIAGKYEPSGLLPFQMPESMDAVEAHLEDTPRDVTPYTDGNGNTWDFAYGLNWSGVIDDERVKKYK